jgi:hypothetical protein
MFGLIMGFGVERAMNAMLFDAGYVDLVAYLIVVPSLLAATMLAAYPGPPCIPHLPHRGAAL